MTLILTELSKAGIAMAADSAISTWKNGKISTVDRRQWKKLLKVQRIKAGISYWGFVGKITTKRFDEWLESKINDTDCYTDLRSFADYLASEMNHAVGDKALPDNYAAGIHVAGFELWGDGVSRPTLYHIHNGPSDPYIIIKSASKNGQTVILERELIEKMMTRSLFARHNDFSPESKSPSDANTIFDSGASYLTTNGDYYPFQLISNGLAKVFEDLNTIRGISVPRDPAKLGSHVGLLKTLMDITIAIYKCSTMRQVIGGKVRAFGIRQDGTYVGD
jgi:hypothetical protein